jgi:hypothetical protein
VGIVKAGTTLAIPAIVIIIVILFTWWRVRRARAQQQEDASQSLLSARALANDLLALFRAGRDRMGGLVELVERYGLGARFFAAISIRRIYANLIRLATEAGYPRGEAQTPYEYLATLCEALPGSRDDVEVITEAYVQAHYGEVPDTRDGLRRIRECWQRVSKRESERQRDERVYDRAE